MRIFPLRILLLMIVLLAGVCPVHAADESATARNKGLALAMDMITQPPDQSSVINGVLKICPAPRKTNEFEMRLAIEIKDGKWLAVYDATNRAGKEVRLTITHVSGKPNQYELVEKADAASPARTNHLSGAQTMVPFAGSDFWIADFGLEFFHWPDQKLLKTEMRRSRSCYILESVKTAPAAGTYSKVISSIHVETGGIVMAEAFDAGGKKLKDFEPTKLEKVNGVYQLKEMVIRNVQTGSRSILTFDLEIKQAP